MRNVLSFLLCVMMLTLVGCVSGGGGVTGGTGGAATNPAVAVEERGFDFGSHSHFATQRGRDPFKIEGLPAEEQMLTLLTDLTRQRMIQKSIPVEVVQQFVGYSNMERTGKMGGVEIALIGTPAHPVLNYTFIYRPAKLANGAMERPPRPFPGHMPRSGVAAIET